ncbi:MAG TPA: DUF4360 domain-containing protein [Pilimelia sp.]|nr:DUF4360 domain-containing protein [Pilimelia sp.]
MVEVGSQPKRGDRSSIYHALRLSCVVGVAVLVSIPSISGVAQATNSAELHYAITSYEGDGCPSGSGTVRPPRTSPNDKSVFPILFDAMRVSVEGTTPEGKPVRRSIGCRVGLKVTLDEDYPTSVREMLLTGGRAFETGTRGFVETGLFDQKVAKSVPSYTARHHITASDRNFMASAMDNDNAPRKRGDEIQLVLDVRLTAQSGARGEAAHIELTGAEGSVKAFS